MKPMLWEEFISFYQKYGKMPHQIHKPNNPLNEQQLRNGYQKYCTSIGKTNERNERNVEKMREKIYQIDEKWIQIREQVFRRDGYKCVLLKNLTQLEYSILQMNAGKMIKIIDPAHILSRSTHSKLYYNVDNIVTLNRYSHSMLDSFHHPLYGNSISKEEQQEWWIKIIGKNRYDMLVKKSKE